MGDDEGIGAGHPGRHDAGRGRAAPPAV